jgi:acyl carrier protein
MLDSDALVIGAGPAGASAAIRLAEAGWRVVLVEQSEYPRQKVCGECITAGSLPLLDELGIGREFAGLAGAELRVLGWWSGAATRSGDFPACSGGAYRFGRAIGRDVFDSLLLARARAVGVRILQPAKVRSVSGSLGRFRCRIEPRASVSAAAVGGDHVELSAGIVIDAHGSWEIAPSIATCARDVSRQRARAVRRPSDLFAFKARFAGADLAAERLTVLAFPGGYGGIVVADRGQTTLACCIRRDFLYAVRSRLPELPAGPAVETMLIRTCDGLRRVLQHARRSTPWMSVGPIRPGKRLSAPLGVFRIGNAAGESHPLIGEGIGMALQSAKLLTGELTLRSAANWDAGLAAGMQRRYARAWNRHFAPRLRVASVYAQVAMHPTLAASANALLRHWPRILTHAARIAGKSRDPIGSLTPTAAHLTARNDMNTLETLQDILVRDYHLTRERVVPEAELVSLGLDSLSVLELMFKIEDRFALKITGDPPTDLQTVGDVTRYIDGQLADRKPLAEGPNKAASAAI